MASGTGYISEKDFNSKIKNYLRDFYVYQFKNKNFDFYNKGSFSKSRMTAVCVLSFYFGCEPSAFLNLRMRDIKTADDGSVTFTVKADDGKTDLSITAEKPLSEIFKYLSASEQSAFFLTGNTGAPKKDKLEAEYKSFLKSCSHPRTVDKLYRYWGQVYLEEANSNITASTYRNDSGRIEALVSRMAGVTWKYGKKVDRRTETLTEKDDAYIECVTADTRELKENPFHLVYRYCNRYSSSDNDIIGIYFAVMLYFNIGKGIRRYDELPVSPTRLSDFFVYLQQTAVNCFNSDRSWDKLTEKQKRRYSAIAVECFLRESYEALTENALVVEKLVFTDDYKEKCRQKKKKKLSWEDIRDDNIAEILTKIKRKLRTKDLDTYIDVYIYLIENRKKIAYGENGFFITDAEHIEKKALYLALSEFLDCGEKQFLNIMREFVKTGIIRETRELILKSFNSSDENEILGSTETVLSSFSRYNFEFSAGDEKNTYLIRFDSNTDSSIINELKFSLSDVYKECINSDKIYFSLSENTLGGILHNDSELTARFSQLVSFFAATEALGAAGSFIADRLPAPEVNIYYKHNFIIRALNDYNNADLLYAMHCPSPEKHYWTEIECRDAMNETGYEHFICYPLKIAENVSDGKQYLIYYRSDYRSISSLRIDFIDSITLGTKEFPPYFEDDLKNAKELMDCTWGLSFGDFYEGNVKTPPRPCNVSFTVEIDTKAAINGKTAGEDFIKNRIRREVGSFTEKRKDERYLLLEMNIRVINPDAMLHWIRSYTGRISDIKIEYGSFMNDIERTKLMYELPQTEHISDELGGERALLSQDGGFTAAEGKSGCLFNLFYSEAVRDFGKTVYKVISGTASEKELISLEGKFSEKSEKGLIPAFSLTENTAFRSIYDIIPMTDTELQWLKNILSEKTARAFLTKEEINSIMSALPEKNFFSFKDDIILLDRHCDEELEKYYSSDIFEYRIREILKLIRERKEVRAEYKTQYNKVNFVNITPVKLVYSRRDNRFRVMAVVRRFLKDKKEEIYYVKTFSVDGILSLRETGRTFSLAHIKKYVDIYNSTAGGKKKLIIYFSESSGVADRILTEFSCYEKTCIRWGSGRYRMELTYYAEDYKEIVIRLLGYGSLISVSSSDDGDPVVSDLKSRYERQSARYSENTRSKDISEREQ